MNNNNNNPYLFNQIVASTYINRSIKIIPSLSPQSFFIQKRKIDWSQKKILLRCVPISGVFYNKPNNNNIIDLNNYVNILLTYEKNNISLTIMEIGGWCSLPYREKYIEFLPISIFDVAYREWLIFNMICRRRNTTMSRFLCHSPNFDRNILYLIGEFFGIPFQLLYKQKINK